MDNRQRVILIVLTLFLILIPVASAATFLDPILETFSGNWAQTYINNAPFIDAVIYFILFASLAKFAIGEKFKGAKILPIMLGVILGIGMIVFEQKSGFRLGNIAWFAALFAFVWIGYSGYSFAKKIGWKPFAAFTAGFIILWILVYMGGPTIMDEIRKIPMLNSVFNLASMAVVIGAPASALSYFKRNKSGATDLNLGSQGFNNALGAQNSDKNTETQALTQDILAGKDVEQLLPQFKTLEQALSTINAAQINNYAQLQDMLMKVSNAVKTLSQTRTNFENALKNNAYMNISQFEQQIPIIESNIKYVDDMLTNIHAALTNLTKNLSVNAKQIEQQLKTDLEKIMADERRLVDLTELESRLKDSDDMSDPVKEKLAQLKASRAELNRLLAQDTNMEQASVQESSEEKQVSDINAQDLLLVEGLMNTPITDRIDIISITKSVNPNNPSQDQVLPIKLLKQEYMAAIMMSLQKLWTNSNTKSSLEQKAVGNIKQRFAQAQNSITLKSNELSKINRLLTEIIALTNDAFRKNDTIFAQFASQAIQIINDALKKSEILQDTYLPIVRELQQKTIKTLSVNSRFIKEGIIGRYSDSIIEATNIKVELMKNGTPDPAQIHSRNDRLLDIRNNLEKDIGRISTQPK